VTFHDHVLSICVLRLIPGTFSVMTAETLKVVREPAMSQADASDPVAKSSAKEALRACVFWCPCWIGMRWVWALVEVLQYVLLDEGLYRSLRWSCWFVGVLNEWQDVVVYPVKL